MSYHIVPDDGGWAVRRGGADRASAICPTKQEAIDVGRTLAQNARTELVIHGLSGQIQNSNSFGNDPFPPRDRKH